MAKKRVVVFVHGWSVHHTKTYGVLPARLAAEARKDKNLDLDIRQIWLGKYISFKDQVRLDDISKGFDAAIKDTLGDVLNDQRKFVCITHSTGGPVVRNWLDQYYVVPEQIDSCPMSHLIMLAPANFGSALAQLGKGRLSRMKFWWNGVEPGQKVLDWLELGSAESWDLNRRWIQYSQSLMEQGPVFPFVITGQTIDRKVYDHINPYTGELGGDGVVRMAAANLNATYVRLAQGAKSKNFTVESIEHTAPTAFCIAKGCCHTGKDKGIMESVSLSARKKHPVVDAILASLKVSTVTQYQTLCKKFDVFNEKVRKQELVEVEKGILRDRHFIHDPSSMVVFRIKDDHGLTLGKFDLKFTAGKKDDPNHLPTGFLIDRQRNQRDGDRLTFYFNSAVMHGSPAIKLKVKGKEKILRDQLPGTDSLGIMVEPHITDGFVHFKSAKLAATQAQLQTIINDDQTTLVDIVMKRVVHEGVFRLTKRRWPEEFKDTPPGKVL